MKQEKNKTSNNRQQKRHKERKTMFKHIGANQQTQNNMKSIKHVTQLGQKTTKTCKNQQKAGRRWRIYTKTSK